MKSTMKETGKKTREEGASCENVKGIWTSKRRRVNGTQMLLLQCVVNEEQKGNLGYLLAGSLLPAEQLSQTGQAASSLQEFVGEELVGGSAAVNIDAEADAQESLELLAELLGLLETGGSVGGNKVEGLEGLFVQVGGLRLDHFDGHNAQRPAVNLRAILLLLDHLGCHPVRSADHGSALVLVFGQLGAEAEISDLDVANTVEEDIVTLDITVDNALVV